MFLFTRVSLWSSLWTSVFSVVEIFKSPTTENTEFHREDPRRHP
jgi:hypothetical protein